MVKKGDTIEDVIKYVEFRIQHLKLEREKVPFIVPTSSVVCEILHMRSKIIELERVKKVLHENIKDHSKYEWNKWHHLKKMKAMINREKEENRQKE